MSAPTITETELYRKIETETLDDAVPVSKIFWDARYGRPPRQRFVDKLASEWDRGRVGVLYLSLRSSGMYAALDGMQRRLACEKAEGPDAVLPARVWIDQTVEQEAELFRAFNQDRRPLLPGDIFRAKLAAGDIAALATRRIIEANGFHVGMSAGGQQGWNVVTAIRTVESIYADCEGEGLTEIIQVLRAVWQGRKGCVEVPALGGMRAFWIRYRNGYDKTHLVTVMRKRDPSELLRGIGAYETLGLRGDRGNMAGQVLLGWYNHGLSTQSQLPEWKAVVQTPTGMAARAEGFRTPIIADMERFLREYPMSTGMEVARGAHHSYTTVQSLLKTSKQFRGAVQGQTRIVKWRLVRE